MITCIVCGIARNPDACYSFSLLGDLTVYCCASHEMRAAFHRITGPDRDPDYLPLDVIHPYDPDYERDLIASTRAQAQTDKLLPGVHRARRVHFHNPRAVADDDPTSILDEQEIDHRAEALERIARGLGLPPIPVPEGSHHWSHVPVRVTRLDPDGRPSSQSFVVSGTISISGTLSAFPDLDPDE